MDSEATPLIQPATSGEDVEAGHGASAPPSFLGQLRRRATNALRAPRLDGQLTASRRRAASVLSSAVSRSRDANKTGKMSQIIRELEDGQAKNERTMLFGFVMCLNHFLGGIVTLHVLEGWSLVDCAYFTVVVTTTVGYGDISPSRVSSKLFVCYYILVSVVFISTLLAYFVGLLIEKQEELVMTSIHGEEGTHDHGVINDDTGELIAARMSGPVWFGYDLGPTLSHLGDYAQMGYTGLFLLLLLFLGGLLFWYFENLTIVDALYVTIISATTVGFGDIEPTRAVTKSAMVVWLAVTTLTVAKLVADQSDAYVRGKQRDVTRRLLGARMDMGALRKMDQDGDGKVDKTEFLVGCLLKLGKVEAEDVHDILQRFDQLDVNHDGQIAVEDIQYLARSAAAAE